MSFEFVKSTEDAYAEEIVRYIKQNPQSKTLIIKMLLLVKKRNAKLHATSRDFLNVAGKLSTRRIEQLVESLNASDQLNDLLKIYHECKSLDSPVACRIKVAELLGYNDLKRADADLDSYYEGPRGLQRTFRENKLQYSIYSLVLITSIMLVSHLIPEFTNIGFGDGLTPQEKSERIQQKRFEQSQEFDTKITSLKKLSEEQEPFEARFNELFRMAESEKTYLLDNHRKFEVEFATLWKEYNDSGLAQRIKDTRSEAIEILNNYHPVGESGERSLDRYLYLENPNDALDFYYNELLFLLKGSDIHETHQRLQAEYGEPIMVLRLKELETELDESSSYSPPSLVERFDSIPVGYTALTFLSIIGGVILFVSKRNEES